MSFALSSSIARDATFTAPAHTYTGSAFDTLRTMAPRPTLDAAPAAPRARFAAFGRRA